MLNEYLDKLTIEQLVMLSKEICFRIHNERAIKERTGDINKIYFSPRAERVIKNTGVKTMVELNQISSDEILKTKNVGRITVKEFDDKFKELGMDWDFE
jgi:DNA-directed RNA polymerase alpha subunit